MLGLAILRGGSRTQKQGNERPDVAAVCLTVAVDVGPGQLAIRIRVGVLGRIEKRQGFGPEDYDMPAEVHDEYSQIQLPHFNTSEFFGEMKKQVLARFDEMLLATFGSAD